MAEKTSVWSPASTCIVAGFFAFFTAQVHFAFVAVFFLPFILIYFLCRSVTAIWKQHQRRPLVKQTSIWVVAFAIVAACHYYWFVASRADADRLVLAVMDYKNRTGDYPPTAASLGHAFDSPRSKWMLGYVFRDGKPNVIYAATFIIFDAYDFDFDSRTWHYIPG